MLSLFSKYALPLIVSICLLLSFALFANTFSHQWTYDDYPVIVENPDILSVQNFIDDKYPGRPLREMTYLLDHALFGMEPTGWHIQSIFWHALCGTLIALLMARLGFGWSAGMAAGLIFLVHPITVESVANISHRKESLALAFSLIALLLYHAATSAKNPEKRIILLGCSLVSTVVACFGKQTAVMVPALLLCCEWIFVERSRWLLMKWWRLWLGIFSLSSLAGLVYLFKSGAWTTYEHGMLNALQYKANYFGYVDFGVYVRMILKSWAFSFQKIFWPLELAVEYTFSVPLTWSDTWVLGGMALMSVVCGCLIWFLVHRSAGALFLAITACFYLPVSNVWPLAYLAADRYMYVPWAGLAMLVGWVLTKTIRSPQTVVWVSVVIAIPLAILTWQQNRVWSDRVTLWTHAYQVNPTSSFVLNNMGNIHFDKGELSKAAGYYQRALETNPLNPSVWFNLGNIFERRNNLSLALKFYQQFINLNDSSWRREIEQLNKRLISLYGIRLSRGKFDPSPPRP